MILSCHIVLKIGTNLKDEPELKENYLKRLSEKEREQYLKDIGEKE